MTADAPGGQDLRVDELVNGFATELPSPAQLGDGEPRRRIGRTRQRWIRTAAFLNRTQSALLAHRHFSRGIVEISNARLCKTGSSPMPTELCRETTRFDRQRTTAPLRKTRWCLTVQNTQTAIRTSIERASRRKRSSQVALNPDFFALSPLSHERRAVAALRPTPAEPLSLASACAALTLVAAIASCLPVRLAARIESGADCGTSERGRRSASRDFECGLKGASGVAGSPGTGHPGAKEPARGRRGASPGASLLPDVPPQPRFHDLRIGAERRTSPPAVQSPRCRSEKPVGRLVAVGHGIWIDEPGTTHAA